MQCGQNDPKEPLASSLGNLESSAETPMKEDSKPQQMSIFGMIWSSENSYYAAKHPKLIWNQPICSLCFMLASLSPSLGVCFRFYRPTMAKRSPSWRLVENLGLVLCQKRAYLLIHTYKVDRTDKKPACCRMLAWLVFGEPSNVEEETFSKSGICLSTYVTLDYTYVRSITLKIFMWAWIDASPLTSSTQIRPKKEITSPQWYVNRLNGLIM